MMEKALLDEQLLLTSKRFQHSRKYWLQYFDELKEYSDVQLLNGSPQSLQEREGHFHLDSKLAGKIDVLCKNNELSIYIYMLTAISVVTRKLQHTPLLKAGCPVFRNGYHAIEKEYNSLLPLLFTVENDDTFRDHLSKVANVVAGAIQHQHYPLDRIYTQMQNDPVAGGIDIAFVCDVLHVKSEVGDIKASLVIHLEIEGNQLYLELKCSGDLPFTMARFYSSLCAVIDSSLEDISRRIASIGLISDGAEKSKILQWSKPVGKPGSAVFCLADQLWQQITRQVPEAPAIIANGKTISYGELLAAATGLTRCLGNKWGLQPGDRVMVLIDRTEWILISLVSIWKAGLVYVPVDVETPPDRIRLFLEEVHPALTLVDAKFAGLASEFPTVVVDVASLPTLTVSGKRDQAEEIGPAGNPDEAYIIYTSGSSGVPKGVVVTHGNVNHFFEAVCLRYGGHQPYCMPFLASHAFDISLFQLLTPILFGGTSLVIGKMQLQDLPLLVSLLKGTTVIDTVPAVYNMIAEHILSNGLSQDFCHIQRIFIGGDSIADELLVKLHQTFVNAIVTVTYGPTEGTIFCTDVEYRSANSSGGDSGAVIGRPVHGAEIYILDENMHLMPEGLTGEICIGGPGVAQGYFGRSQLTAEKFLSNPYHPGSRLYRTGDSGQWTADGRIKFKGRIDDQIKIRGFRIEPAEIANVIKRHDLIADVEVIPVADSRRQTSLAAFCILKTGILPSQSDLDALLSGYTQRYLPDYMVPAHFLPLEKMPLTSNGKVDRKALREAISRGLNNDNHIPALPGVQQDLADIWKDLLKIDRVGVKDNFFSLGGDSIISIQVVSRARRIGYDIRPRDIFKYQNIEALAASLADKAGEEVVSLNEQGMLQGPVGLLPVQQLFFEMENPVVSHFNQSILLAVDKEIGENELRKAVNQLITHHDALRFSYVARDGSWVQQYVSHSTPIEIEDFRAEAADNLPGLIESCSNRHQQDISIENGRVAKFVWFRTNAAEEYNRLLIIIHHLAVDGVSWRILLEDLEHLLSASEKVDDLPLGLKSGSYRQWYDALAEYGRSDRLLSQRDYWERTVHSYKPLFRELEYENVLKVSDRRNCVVSLNAVCTKALLQDVPSLKRFTVNDLLLCALAMTLSKWNNTDTVVVGLEGHGREDIGVALDVSRTVGWFASLYPVLLTVEAGKDVVSLLKGIKEQLRKIPDKGIGYGVLKYLAGVEAMQAGAGWDVVFNYHGRIDNVMTGRKWLTPAKESPGPNIHPENRVLNKIEINCHAEGGRLFVDWGFCTGHYRMDTMKRMAEDYLSNLAILVECSTAVGSTSVAYTPSDFGLENEISYVELDVFLSEPIDGKQRSDVMESMYRLTGLQEGMLFHGLYNDTGVNYIVQVVANLPMLNIGLFRECWDNLLQRHSILRTGFHYDTFKVPVQSVYKNVRLPIEDLDFRLMSGEELHEAIRAFDEADRRKGFDFRQAPLMRITLIRLDVDVYRMVWTSHHILTDGWSLPILLKEFFARYEALNSGREAEGWAPDNFEDFVRYIGKRDKYLERAFWEGYLKGIEGPTLLPFVKAVAERNKGVGNYRKQRLDFNVAVTKEIVACTQRRQLTVNTLIQGVWAFLLNQYTGSRDIIYGITVAGRPEDLPFMEERVGLYINTLPLRSKVDGEQTILLWLKEIQDDQSRCREYQYNSLADIQRWAEIRGDLFDTLLVFENYPIGDMANDEGRAMSLEKVEMREQINYPFGITVSLGNELAIQFDYNADLLPEVYVNLIAGHFEQVLLAIMECPDDVRLREITLPVSGDRQKIDGTINGAAIEYPADKTMLDLFEEQVAIWPESVAVVMGARELSYQELDIRSNQLGHYLRNQGVREDCLVAICMERSVDLIIGILGILKAGGAYVPIDPAYPQERIRYILEDTDASLVVGCTASGDTSFGDSQVVLLDKDWDRIRLESRHRPERNLRPEHAAYIIYTSGSTGTPKGVMIEHRNITRLFKTSSPVYDFTNNDVWTMFHSVCFDFSVWEMYGALLFGGKLVIVPKEVARDSQLFADLLIERKVTVLNQTPSAFYVLRDEMVNDGRDHFLRYVIFGGEALSPGKVKRWKERYGACRLINMYGITETTVHVTFQELSMEHMESGTSVIGRPIPTLSAYIVNSKYRRLLPMGVPGELYIGGAGLARGYLNRPELTRDRFIEDAPFGGRLYRTGDMARWLADGNIEYLGRSDEQVKVRGYRVEPGEVEQALESCPGVGQAAVVAREDGIGNRRLIGYVVAQGLLDRDVVLMHLKEQLPEYMVPSILVELARLPLTANGKLDRGALPDPGIKALSGRAYMAPQSQIEQTLSEIWRELLGVERVGINEDFFEMGGHSLLATRLAVAIKKEFHLKISLRALFELSTIKDLASYVELQLSSDFQNEETAPFEVINL
jgi:amino acid adenylation domain-containing protein/non-ribosomal peptide synthase protein (TIGR01720 family)